MSGTSSPNILFIVTDQQRWDTLGCYGNDIVETPNLDALAEDGVLFEDTHCTHPLCTPSRASLLTGRYPSTHGLWRNGVPLDEDETTVADVLGENEYDTGLVGKAHFSPYHSDDPERFPESVRPAPDDPAEDWEFWREFEGPYYGFDHLEISIGHGDYGINGGHYGLWLHENHRDEAHLFDQEHALEDSDPAYPSWKSATPVELHSTTWVADRSIEYIEDHSDGEPFFLWAGIPDPHPPFDPPAPYCDMYDPEEVPLPVDREGTVWEDVDLPRYVEHYYLEREKVPDPSVEKIREIVAHYYGMVSLIDDAVGRMLAALEREGIADETLVVFTSDHGEWLGDHGLWTKGAVHTRGVTQVPMMFRWPGVGQSGRRVSSVASQIDLVPTLVDAAGVEIPYGAQGTSLRPVLTGEREAVRPYALVEHYHEAYRDDWGMGAVVNWTDEPIVMKTLITDEHRLSEVEGIETDYGELFDREADPGETDNRWFDDTEIRDRLRIDLLHAVMEAEDPLPEREHPV